MGFVPLAYRAGSEKKGRVHLFWQKRIRSGDGETPWWYPSSTDGGAMREGRLVLPIPPGKHWGDELPVLMPAAPVERRLPAPGKARETAAAAAKGPLTTAQIGMRFGAAVEEKKAEPKPREKKPKRKNDPKLVAAARELRDRWLEHVNGAGGAGETLIEGAGKYDVTRQRQLTAAATHTPLLPAA
jgi:hypothetical protein